MSRKAKVVPTIMDDSRMEDFTDHWQGALDIIVVIQHLIVGKGAGVLQNMNYLARQTSPESHAAVRKAIRQIRKDGYGTTASSKTRKSILVRHFRLAKDEIREATHALWQADEDIDPPEIPRHMRTAVLLDEHLHDLLTIVGRLIDAQDANETTRVIWAVRAQDKAREIDRILNRLRQSPMRPAKRRDDGWTASELYKKGQVSASWFAELCKRCPGISRPGSGHHEFRFTRAAVDRLIQEARDRGTTKLRYAADQWSAMLADSGA